MTDAAAKDRIVARGEAVTLGSNPKRDVSTERALPNITILIHGVNDLGEAYNAQEQGICEGLNERLNRKSSLSEAGGDLVPNHYFTKYADALAAAKTDAEHKALEYNPDSAMYHRIKDKNAYSPVVPFYWGFREDGEIDPKTKLPKYINTTAKHGEWTDRFGTRIDKDAAKGGGPFPNATSNLPDMFGPGFKKTPISGDPTHPLLPGPGRRYMVLAAMRLANLIKIIRANPDTKTVAINIVAHSQGCMVSLLAHALLACEKFTEVADCLIMNDAPYSLEEPLLEWKYQAHNDQQTTQARVTTLINIAESITAAKKSSPALNTLEKCDKGTAGENWKAGKGAKKWHAGDGKVYSFEERDNRGKVYLYFCLKDATVALENVQGIGWKGLPDSMRARTPASKITYDENDSSAQNPFETLPVFDALKTKRFYQRVFSSQIRSKQPIPVGLPPNKKFVLKETWETSELPSVWSMNIVGAATTSDVHTWETRDINGEELFPPCVPVLNTGEDKGHEGTLLIGEIDARIALSFNGIDQVRYTQRDARTAQRYPGAMSPADIQAEIKLLQAEWDAAHPDPYDAATITDAYATGHFMHITRSETPREARTRWTTTKYDKNSYHSGIVTNSANSAMVTAYDLALGKPIQPDLSGFLKYLVLAADWRTDWKAIERKKEENKVELEYAAKVTGEMSNLIKETQQYYKTGVLPNAVLTCKIDDIKLIRSQTLTQREFQG